MKKLFLLLFSSYPLVMQAQITTSIPVNTIAQIVVVSTDDQIKAVVSQIKAKADEIKILGNQLKLLQDQLSVLKKQQAILHSQIDIIEGNKPDELTDAKKKQLEKLNNDLTQLNNNIAVVQKNIETAITKIETAKKELEKLQQKLAQLETQAKAEKDAAAATNFALIKKILQKTPFLKEELSAHELKMYDFYDSRYKTDTNFRKATDAALAVRQAENDNSGYEETKAKMKATFRLIQDHFDRQQQTTQKMLN